MRHLISAFAALCVAVAPAANGAASAPPLSPQQRQLVNDRMGLLDSEIVRLDRRWPVAQPFEAAIEIAGQALVLNLRPHSVRAEGYAVFAAGKDGAMVPVEPAPVNTYRGEVLGLPGSVVAASLMEDGLHAMVDFAGGDRFWIEPIARRVEFDAAGLHAVYHDIDVIPSGGTCGVNDAVEAEEEGAPAEGPQPLGAGICTAQLACDADYEYYLDWGSNTTTVQNRINAIINTVNNQYEDEVFITHLITTIVIRTNSNDPYTASGASALLDQFRAEWNSNQGGIQRDLAHLFTGRNLSGSTIGIAFTGTVCNISNAYSLVESDCCGAFACATDLSAHELGHNWNALHCSCLGFTMHSGLQCANQFSSTSIAVISAFRDSRPCLDCAPATQYCAASSNSTSGERITNVQLGTINNSSGASTYSNFTNISTQLVRGQPYTFSMTIGNASPTAIAGFFVDLNGDNDFNDAFETVEDGFSGTGPYQKTFTPLTFWGLGSTRLRIRLQDAQFNSVINSCGTTTQGEVEDYTVIIVDPPMGGCCTMSGNCFIFTATQCANVAGLYQGDGSNCAPCQTATGACCLPDGGCMVLSADDCSDASGTYQGDDAGCLPCPQPTGACCFTDGSCTVETSADCIGAGGAYSGDGTGCSPNDCPPPATGACCFTDGSCTVGTSADCIGAGGAYSGDGTGCSPNDCPPPATGACCFTDGSCMAETSGACATAGGAYSGDGTGCSPNDCPPGCPADFNGDGSVGFSDLNVLLANWGDCAGCPGDFDGSGVIGFGDLNQLLEAWGPC